MKTVLDATCGSRMIWFNPNNPIALFVDKRQIEHEEIWHSKNGKNRRYLTVKPDVIADYKELPFDDEIFYLVVFDPPHLLRGGDTGWQVKKYGRLPVNWEEELRQGFNECMRVLKQHGTLIFKWCEVQIPVSRVIKALGDRYYPLFGNRCGKQGKTHWMCFIKEEICSG